MCRFVTCHSVNVSIAILKTALLICTHKFKNLFAINHRLVMNVSCVRVLKKGVNKSVEILSTYTANRYLEKECVYMCARNRRRLFKRSRGKLLK